MVKKSDKITIVIHGSEKNRQLVTDEICEYLCELAERLACELAGQRWGFTMDSTRAPSDGG